MAKDLGTCSCSEPKQKRYIDGDAKTGSRSSRRNKILFAHIGNSDYKPSPTRPRPIGAQLSGECVRGVRSVRSNGDRKPAKRKCDDDSVSELSLTVEGVLHLNAEHKSERAWKRVRRWQVARRGSSWPATVKKFRNFKLALQFHPSCVVS